MRVHLLGQPPHSRERPEEVQGMTGPDASAAAPSQAREANTLRHVGQAAALPPMPRYAVPCCTALRCAALRRASHLHGRQADGAAARRVRSLVGVQEDGERVFVMGQGILTFRQQLPAQGACGAHGKGRKAANG